jgi:hypothetical protein
LSLSLSLSLLSSLNWHLGALTSQSTDPEVMFGQQYDLAGPEDYTHREVHIADQRVRLSWFPSSS